MGEAGARARSRTGRLLAVAQGVEDADVVGVVDLGRGCTRPGLADDRGVVGGAHGRGDDDPTASDPAGRGAGRPPPWTWCRGEPRRAPSAPRPPAWPRTAQTSFRTRLVGEKTARRRSFLDAASAMPPRATVASRFSPKHASRSSPARGRDLQRPMRRDASNRRFWVRDARRDRRHPIPISFHRPRGEIHRNIGRKRGFETPSRRHAIRRGAGWWAVSTRSRARRRSTTRADGFFNRQPPPRTPRFPVPRGTVPPCRITWAAC